MAVTGRARVVAVNGALLLVTAIVLAPVAWMIAVSLMTPGEAMHAPAPLLPRAPTTIEYRKIFGDYAIGVPMLNSIIVALLTTAGSLALMLPAGYAFAKLRFRGREATVRGLLSLLIVPPQIAMLPLFLLLKEVGLVNTYAGVVAPWLASIFGVLFVRQAALSLPDEMLDAARVDGASEWAIFRYIAEPLLRPITATLALFTFLGSWNDFMWPLIVLSDSQLYTLPVALATLSREHAQNVELMMAGAVVTTLPVVFVFLPLQRFYIGGMLGGAIKG